MKFKLSRTDKIAISSVLISAFILFAGLSLVNSLSNSSLVPASVKSKASFPVYYPNPAKLPAGFKLETSSFSSPQPGIVIYKVSNGSNEVIFSEEAAQPASVVNSFLSDYIPLHRAVNTPLGQAQAGAYVINNSTKSVISLAIANGPWLIATAPGNLSQTSLNSLVQNLTK